MAFGIFCAVAIELGPTQCDGPVFRIYGSPFFIMFFSIHCSKTAVIEGVVWAVFRLADHSVQYLVTLPIRAFGVAEVEKIGAPFKIGHQTRIAPNAVWTGDIASCVQLQSAVRALVEIIQYRCGIYILCICWVHGYRLARRCRFDWRALRE